MESDWKYFREIVPQLRERYLADRNARIVELLVDHEKNGTERFWEALDEMEKVAGVLRNCLDGHTRSKMVLYVLMMIRAGMLREEDLEGFSGELLRKIAHALELTKEEQESESA